MNSDGIFTSVSLDLSSVACACLLGAGEPSMSIAFFDPIGDWTIVPTPDWAALAWLPGAGLLGAGLLGAVLLGAAVFWLAFCAGAAPPITDGVKLRVAAAGFEIKAGAGAAPPTAFATGADAWGFSFIAPRSRLVGGGSPGAAKTNPAVDNAVIAMLMHRIRFMALPFESLSQQ